MAQGDGMEASISQSDTLHHDKPTQPDTTVSERALNSCQGGGTAD